MSKFKLIDKATRFIADFYKSIDKNNVLSFSEITEETATIAYINKTIYGICLESKSNILLEADIKYFFEKLKTYTKSEILINIIKNTTEYNVYIYSTNKEIMELIMNLFAVEKFMTGEEIVNSFADYFMFNSYEVKNNTLYDLNQHTVYEIGIKNNLFHKIAEFSSYNVLKENDVFQLTAFKEASLQSFYDLMQEKWEGVLSIYINGENKKKEGLFKIKKRANKAVDNELAKIYGALEKEHLINEIISDTLIVNMIFLGKEKEVGRISSKTGFDFTKNEYDGDKIYKQTLLKHLNSAFSFFMPYNKLGNVVNSSKKKQIKPYFGDVEEWLLPDFYGKDYAGGFINHCFKSNSNTHALIIGETGSGKTTGTLQTVSSGMGFDEELNSELFEKGLVALRYFDVDFSAGGFINKLRNKYPDKCRIIGEEIMNLKFNILDVELNEKGRVSDVDKNIIVSFMDMVLQLGQTNGLTAPEKNVLNKAINYVLNKDYKYIDYSLGEIENKEGYSKIIKELYGQGYTEISKISELPEEYIFFKKPTLVDIKNYLSRYKNDSNITPIEKEATESVISKIEYLIGLGVFGFLSNTNFKEDKPVFYMDVSTIRNSTQLFVSIVWLMLMDLVKNDKNVKHQMVKEGKPKRKVYYVIEEAHNFLSVPTFKKIFSELSKELRKYNIHLIFLIHRVTDIEPDIYKSVATKMFFFKPGSFDLVKREIQTVESLSSEEEKVFKLVKGISHGIFIKHSYGADSFQFTISPEKLKMFRQEIVR